MKTIRAIIVDDEHYAREVIRHLLKKDQDIELLEECTNGYEAVEAIVRHRPDLVFLDIQMPEMDGFQVIRQAEHFYRPYYIFATAYDSFALKAFDVNALDYLLKPFDDERFFQALQKAKALIHQQETSNIGDKIAGVIEFTQANKKPIQRFASKIPIRETGRIYFIQTETIDWIEAADQYVQIHCGDKSFLLRESMNEMEQQLNPQLFFRIHRSTIINLTRIQELQPFFKGDYIVVLQDGTQLKLTRSRKEAFQEALGIDIK